VPTQLPEQKPAPQQIVPPVALPFTRQPARHVSVPSQTPFALHVTV
jgi:hypothetical protein